MVASGLFGGLATEWIADHFGPKLNRSRRLTLAFVWACASVAVVVLATAGHHLKIATVIALCCYIGAPIVLKVSQRKAAPLPVEKKPTDNLKRFLMSRNAAQRDAATAKAKALYDRCLSLTYDETTDRLANELCNTEASFYVRRALFALIYLGPVKFRSGPIINILRLYTAEDIRPELASVCMNLWHCLEIWRAQGSPNDLETSFAYYVVILLEIIIISTAERFTDVLSDDDIKACTMVFPLLRGFEHHYIETIRNNLTRIVSIKRAKQALTTASA